MTYTLTTGEFCYTITNDHCSNLDFTKHGPPLCALPLPWCSWMDQLGSKSSDMQENNKN